MDLNRWNRAFVNATTTIAAKPAIHMVRSPGRILVNNVAETTTSPHTRILVRVEAIKTPINAARIPESSSSLDFLTSPSFDHAPNRNGRLHVILPAYAWALAKIAGMR